MSDWLRLAGVLGAELGLLGLVCWALALVQRRSRETTAAWPRMWWRSGVLGVLIITGVELSGARDWVGSWLEALRRSPVGAVQVRTDLEPTLTVAPPGRAAGGLPSRMPAAIVSAPPVPVTWPAAGWLAGAVVVFGRMLWARGVFAWVLHRRAQAAGERIRRRAEHLSEVLGLRRRVCLRCLDALPGPVACGVVVPTIVLPTDFESAHAEASQDAMLMHELAHVSARDAVWHGLADFAAALLWWHPVVWWMRARLLAASELAADEACRSVEDGPRVLAECLVVMARRWVSSSPVAGWQGVHGGRFRSGLGRRVERLLNTDPSAWRPLSIGQRWLGRTGVLLVLGGIAWAGAVIAGRNGALSWNDAWRWSLGTIFIGQGRAAETNSVVEAEAPIAWQTWSPEAVEAVLASGRPVLVFFTADWCVAGQINERTALDVPEVRRRLRELQAVAFKADATVATNAAIERELKSLGNLPWAAVASRATGFKRVVLPEALTADLVLQALDGRLPDLKQSSATASPAELPVTAGAATPSESALANLVTSRLFEARSLYAAGLLTEAEAKFRAIQMDEPRNPAAKHYLELIESKRPASVVRPARLAALNERLDSIVLNSFGGTLPLGEMAMKLFELGKAADPQGAGINIIVSPGAASRDPVTGLPVGEQGETDLRQVTVQIQPALEKVTVRQALQAMMRGAGGLLRFEVADYAVIVSGEPAAQAMVAEELHTRWFRLSETIKAAVAKRAVPDPDEIWPRGVTPETPAEELLRNFRSCLRLVGVTFPRPAAGRSSGRSIFYNDRSDTLMVRATLQELDLVEQVIQELNTPLPQVVLEARFAEVPAESWNALGLEWISGAQQATNHGQGFGWPTNDPSSAVGVLTPALTQVVLKALEQRRGVNLLTAPKITTLTGRQAQVKVVNVRYLVTDVKPADPASGVTQAQPLVSPFEAGPVLDVVPSVMIDRTTVQLSVVASVKEFIGYDPDAPSSSPRPVYRERSMTAPATVWDGQTLVLSGPEDRLEVLRGKGATGPVPAIGPELQRQHAELRPKTKLIVLVTVRLIDATGAPIRSEENLPSGIPPQAKK